MIFEVVEAASCHTVDAAHRAVDKHDGRPLSEKAGWLGDVQDAIALLSSKMTSFIERS